MRKQSQPKWMTLRDLDVRQRAEASEVSRVLKPKTPGQARYLEAIRSSVVTLCDGPAGAGKTVIATYAAAEELRAGRVFQIVVTRPLVSCDEEMGFLPGGVEEKIAPFVAAVRACFTTHTPAGELAAWESSGKLQYHPLATMRGMTFKDSFLLLDESENCTYRQLYMFLTRFGDNARVVVNGDVYQSDIVRGDEDPPIYQVTKRLDRLKGISIIQLGDDDIVRSPLVRDIEKRLR